MSTKTIVEQHAEALAAITALTGERDSLKASVEKLTGEKATAEQAAQDAAQAKADAIAKADATAADLNAKLEAESAAKAAAEKTQAETAAELAKIKNAVASNPAFADAAAKGAKPVADTGGESRDLWAEYNSLKDPVSRARFWQEHEKQLKLSAKKKD